MSLQKVRSIIFFMGVIIIALIIGWCCDAERAKKDADLWYDKGYEEGYASCLDKYGIEE